MIVSTQISGDIGQVSLAGRFTFECHRAFKEATDPFLEDSTVLNIHLNLAPVEDMDASSLGMLLVLREKAELKGKNLTLLNPAPCAIAIIESLHFEKLFTIAK